MSQKKSEGFSLTKWPLRNWPILSMKIAAATTTTTTNRIDLGNPPKKKSINLVVLKRFWDPRWPWRFLGLQSLREAKLIGRRSESFGRKVFIRYSGETKKRYHYIRGFTLNLPLFIYQISCHWLIYVIRSFHFICSFVGPTQGNHPIRTLKTRCLNETTERKNMFY